MRGSIIGLGLAGTLCAAWLAAGEGESVEAPARNFIGAGQCRLCHNAPTTGTQYDRWAQSPHARAFETLGTPEAKKIAAEKGIADPQKAEACLKCHLTAYDAPPERLKQRYAVKDGVSCESCHGPGGDYWPLNVMKDRGKATAAGLIIPNEKTCLRCHNAESPRPKPFDFKTAFAQIAHPNPQRAEPR
jgi:cytochrome c554/c'-like protein